MDFGPQAPMVAAPLSQLRKAKSSSRPRRPGGPQPGPQIWYPAGHPARRRPQPGCATARRYTVPCPPYLFPNTLREYGGPFFIRANLFERGHSNTCNLTSVVFVFFHIIGKYLSRHWFTALQWKKYVSCVRTYKYQHIHVHVYRHTSYTRTFIMYTYKHVYICSQFLIAALAFWRSSPN